VSEFQKLFSEQDDDEPQGGDQPTQLPQLPKKGRAKGKRSDPNYVQVGAYIPRDLDKQVKLKLIESDREFSDLVADLLRNWLSD